MSSVDGPPCEIRIGKGYGPRQTTSHSECCAVAAMISPVVIASGLVDRVARVIVSAVRGLELADVTEEGVATVVREAAAPRRKPTDSQ